MEGSILQLKGVSVVIQVFVHSHRIYHTSIQSMVMPNLNPVCKPAHHKMHGQGNSQVLSQECKEGD